MGIVLIEAKAFETFIVLIETEAFELFIVLIETKAFEMFIVLIEAKAILYFDQEELLTFNLVDLHFHERGLVEDKHFYE